MTRLLLIFKKIAIISATCLSCLTFYFNVLVINEVNQRRNIATTEELNEALSENWDNKSSFSKIESFYGLPNNSLPSIDWSNIVFMMNIFDSDITNELVKRHFQTWLRSVGEGADIIFISDADDSRTYNRILTKRTVGSVNATCHIYKSPAKKEGKRLRFKVIDGFRHIAEKKFNATKKYFIKIDADTYVRPDRLLNYLNNLHKQTYPKPVHFGHANCHGAPFCYTDGAFYGFNEVGFTSLIEFMKESNLTNIFNESTLMGRFMRHEDFMISYAFKEATKYPMIQNPLFHKLNPYFYVSDFAEVRRGISYHPLKHPKLFYELDYYFRFNVQTKIFNSE